jgi:hypothetical protein
MSKLLNNHKLVNTVLFILMFIELIYFIVRDYRIMVHPVIYYIRSVVA